MTSLQPPKRPKPIQPVLNAVVAVLYAAVAVMYFVDGRTGVGALWSALTLAWIWAIFFAVKTHQIQVGTWQIQMRMHDRERQRRLALFVADDVTDAP